MRKLEADKPSPAPISTTFNAVKTLLVDFGRLFAKPGKLIIYLLVMVLVEIGYWYLGSPGPELSGAPRTLSTAANNIFWAVLLLLAIPAALLRVFDDWPSGLTWRWGDRRFGLPATIVSAIVAVVLMYFGAQNPAIQATYPWVGRWAGLSIFNFIGWAALYSLYYLSFEFFYRGFMLRMLEPKWGLVSAIWVQTLASVLIHLGKPLAEVLAALPAGLIFAVLAVRGRSLLWPTLLHLVIGLSTDFFSLYFQGQLFR